jgi:hypothetical protein
MRKSLLVVALLCFALMFVGQAMAQETGGAEWSKTAFDSQFSAAKEVKFMGTVVSHDPMCHCIVVKTPKGNELVLQDDYAKFMQEYNQAKGLKIGAEVAGVYKTVNHIHYLSSIMYKGM